MSKDDYAQMMKEMAEDEGQQQKIMEMSMNANPQLDQLPPALAGLVKELVAEAAGTARNKMVDCSMVFFDLFAKNPGFITFDEYMVSTGLFLPTSAQDKFDEIWALIDTDNDG